MGDLFLPADLGRFFTLFRIYTNLSGWQPDYEVSKVVQGETVENDSYKIS